MTLSRRMFIAATAVLTKVKVTGRASTLRVTQPMREFLVFVQDKHIDPADKDTELDLSSYKKGHVVIICDEGFQWGRIERSYYEWRRFKAPMKQTLVHSLMLPPIQTGNMRKIHRRDWHLDLTKLPGYDRIIDPASISEVFEFTEEEIIRATVQRTS